MILLKKNIAKIFLMFFCFHLFAQEQKMKDFSKILEKISVDNADILLKKNAFPEDIEDTFSRGRLPMPIKGNKENLEKFIALCKDVVLIKNKRFQEHLCNILRTAHPAIICFVITTVSAHNPKNTCLAGKFLSILIDKVQTAKTRDKWKYLYIIEQLLRNIHYTPEFDKFFINNIEKLYPHSEFPLNEELKSDLIELYGKDEVDKLKERMAAKKLTYDKNAYIQFTFILFSYTYFKKDELRNHTVKTQSQKKDKDENPSNSEFDF